MKNSVDKKLWKQARSHIGMIFQSKQQHMHLDRTHVSGNGRVPRMNSPIHSPNSKNLDRQWGTKASTDICCSHHQHILQNINIAICESSKTQECWGDRTVIPLTSHKLPILPRLVCFPCFKIREVYLPCNIKRSDYKRFYHKLNNIAKSEF